jgi:predicted kinase
LPGTGKSHLAEALAERFPLIVLRSDEVRKALFDRPRYTSAENGHVYLTCYALIDSLLRDGYGIVFDATNLMKRGRSEARRLAAAAGAPFVLLVTVSPPEVVAERLRPRAAGRSATYSSDADWGVHEKLAGTMEAISGDREPAVVVDTSLSLQPAFDAIDRALSSTCHPSTEPK